MEYFIDYSEDAERHLSKLRARDQRIIVDAVDAQLMREPTVATRHRKPLRENSLADWELRVGDFRVLYNVDDETRLVIVVAIGNKVHNVFLIEGREYKL
jgi:mRNA-degrading endonuclease RelE of RelBE toxin-antitoxin system